MTLLSWRKKNKLTQKKMAGKLEIDQPYYSRIESGKLKAGMRLVNRIIDLTDGYVGYKVLRPDIYNKIMEEGKDD